MANEATKVELLGVNNSGDPIRYTISSSAAISKGALLKLTDPFTVALASGAADAIAGIAAEDHNGTDYSTSIAVWTNGFFEMKASGAIVCGWGVQVTPDISTYPNHITQALAGTTAASGAVIFGYSRETASAGEVVNVRVRL